MNEPLRESTADVVARRLLPTVSEEDLTGVSPTLHTPEGPRSFWEAVVDLFSDAVFLVGADRRVLYWNRAAEVLTGYARGEVVGRSCLTAIHSEPCSRRCGVFALGNVREVPLTITDRQGRVIEVLKSATVVRSPEGVPTLGIEVLRDVTSRNAQERESRQARNAAEAQQALLRGVLDSVTEGIVGVGADGALRFASASAQALLGLSSDEATGRPIELVAGEAVARHVRHVLASGGSVNATRIELKGPNGAAVPVTVAVSPLHLEGTPDGALVLLHDLRAEERGVRERLRAGSFSYGALISRSPRMREVFDLIDQVAPSTATILIQGESGTGKELIAREVHRRSRRAGGPFHAVNCAAIASEILESEFFGHERGAFTGAVIRKKGRFEVAHTGTIFLDEVGELALELQGKLLRVLEERTFERVGGTETLHVDVRVVAATNRDLAAMVRAGTFREDLYYRLRVVPVRLPPLRERVEDIEPLADHLLRRIAEREGAAPRRLGAEATRQLLDHPWPGNVRELANAMEYAAVVARAPTIGPEDLPRELREAPSPRAAPSVEGAAPPSDALAAERARLEAALKQTHYAHVEAAKLLGMHRTTLYRKRLRHGI